MSFDYNPLKHIELVDDPNVYPDQEPRPDTYVVYCHSCGSSRDRIAKDAPASEAFKVMEQHVKLSHASRMEHFDTWSIY